MLLGTREVGEAFRSYDMDGSKQLEHDEAKLALQELHIKVGDDDDCQLTHAQYAAVAGGEQNARCQLPQQLKCCFVDSADEVRSIDLAQVRHEVKQVVLKRRVTEGDHEETGTTWHGLLERRLERAVELR